MSRFCRPAWCLLLALAAPAAASAQMLGVPVLQNAFYNPGFTVAADYGGGDNATGLGAAAAWAPSSGRFVLSAGAGSYRPDFGSSSFTWGGRVAVPAWQLAQGKAGIAAFGGIGGASRSGNTLLRIPVGLSVGYRTALGSRGVSAYAAPFYSWTRASAAGVSASSSTVRVSFGVDVAVLPMVGLTVGYETGSTVSAAEPGPRGGLFGVGLSYAFRR